MNDYIDRQAAINAAVKMFESWYGGSVLRDKEIRARFDALPSAQRWIPCVIKEPDTIGDYLLYRPHFWGANEGQVTVCYWNGHDWSDNYRNDAERYLPEIFGMAWMPLPEPYKGEGEAHETD